MTFSRSRGFLLFLLVCLAPTPSLADTITGTVRNGTTGRVAGGIDVVLISLQGGMESVTTTKTDAQGKYTLSDPLIGKGPMLVRVQYKGANYHQSAPPGRNEANIEIYEPTAKLSDLVVRQRVILFQPEGTTLVIGEEFNIQNKANPPATYFQEQGSFEFVIPEGATLSQVSAAGPTGMPLVQGTMSKGPNHYAIPFALKPGETTIRMSYQLAYEKNQAAVRTSSPYSTEKVLLWAPTTMQIQADGFARAGSEQGGNISTRESLAAGTAFAVSVSGTAPPSQPADGQQGGGTSSGGQSEGVPIRQVPGRLDGLKWILIAGFSALFGLGLIFLWRQPRAAPVVAIGSSNSSLAASQPASVAGEADGHVQGSLDEIRDTLLRIELRRQAGTISEEEYAAQRGRAEKMLGGLLKG
ncbi:MAG: carboxypeptidase regulatory-like domain-containing protein [Acidobacteria bacterium]|nr:carboxypeptidase regulatory-like domain-containing protein [Acidobacteriota bacterium]